MGQPSARVRRPLTIDTALVAVLFLLALATLHMSPQGHDAWGVGGVVLSAVIALALSESPSRPWPALVVVTGLFLVAQVFYGLVPVFAIMILVAVFHVASRGAGPRAVTAAGALVVAVVVDLSAQLTRHNSWTDSAYLVMATAVFGAAAAGDAVRSRRAYVREVEERARRAEYSREQTVQRRIAEERLSIARDVHDLVAHHLAVISVQAQVADRLSGSPPAPVAEALGMVRAAAGSALGELGTLIGVLRGGSSAPLRPAPTLAELPELMASFRTTGLQVSRSEHGTARPLPAEVDLAAFRVIQESLTNAQKHGSGAAELRITYDPDRVVIEVVNPTRADLVSLGARVGHGLLGMRERVATVGGTVRVEHPAYLEHGDREQFRVLATLPADAHR